MNCSDAKYAAGIFSEGVCVIAAGAKSALLGIAFGTEDE